MSRLIRLSLVLLAFSLAAAACTLPLPGIPAEPSPTFPFPNQTMTALFSTAPAATVTPPPIITATTGTGPAATATKTLVPVLPSNTPLPTVASPTPTTTTTPTTQPTATAKATASATATKTPTATATIDTSRRAGTFIEAGRFSTAPVLDGGWTDFPVKEYPISYVVYGDANWSGEADLSASFRIGWDKNYLYVAVKIHDDKYAQNATGADLFKGDSVEVLLDTDVSKDFFVKTSGSDDYQLGISPGKPTAGTKPEAYLWLPANVAGARTQVKIAATRIETSQLTRVEAAIPWSMLGVTPKAGMHFGFALSVSDNDNTTKNIQQTMISTAKNRNLFDPTTWGDLELK